MTPTGVLLMTYGSATTAAGVSAYMRSVYQGREPAPELVAEFERRYRRIGRSPLTEITLAQAAALQGRLDQRFGPGRFRVEAGMLHSAPSLDAAVGALLRAGAREVLAITLAPQFSPLILAGYSRAVDRIAAQQGIEIRLAGAWHGEPALIASLSARLRSLLESMPAGVRDTVPVVFTAHSLPLAVIERDPDYISQLTDTAVAVARDLDLASGRWQFAYQSAGHAPEPWLEPDLVDLLPTIAAAGHGDVVIAPLQFVADHLEILYDLDVAAREQAEAHGLRYHRMAMPNTSPEFIGALADVVARHVAPAVAR
jgi:protoporphyrin/coproporphyrin ferrochelatase